MDITDIAILAIIAFFAIRGLFAGLIIGVVGMLGIALALIFSYMVYTPIHSIVVEMGVTDDKISSVITYVLGFLLIYIIVFLMGKILHRFIIVTVEIDKCMFGRNIDFDSYCYSIILTVIFTLLVNFAMYFKLKKVDMIESLKSVE